jgi:hypothetical protein
MTLPWRYLVSPQRQGSGCIDPVDCRQVGYKMIATPAQQTVSQLANLHLALFCHSGLDPWFDRLTTLSTVEGESISVSATYASGCRIKSGMTVRK